MCVCVCVCVCGGGLISRGRGTYKCVCVRGGEALSVGGGVLISGILWYHMLNHYHRWPRLRGGEGWDQDIREMYGNL